MTRASISKEFPGSPEKAIPELFEKQTVSLNKLPDSMKKMYVKNLQKDLDRRYKPR